MTLRPREAEVLGDGDGGGDGADKGEEIRLKMGATLLRPLKIRRDQFDLSLNSMDSTPYGRPAYVSVSVKDHARG